MLLFRPDNDHRENPSCRHPEKASDPEARLKERGSRLPRDIFVESYQFSPSEVSAEMAGFVEGTEVPLPRRSSLRESSVVTSSSEAGCREKVGVSVSGGTSKETTPSESSSRSRNRCSFSHFWNLRYTVRNRTCIKIKRGEVALCKGKVGYPGTSVADPWHFGTDTYPLANGSGSDSESCCFRQWLLFVFRDFLLITYFLKVPVHLHHFSKLKSHKEITKQKESRFFLLFLLDDSNIQPDHSRIYTCD